jgi:hypothetical protein
VTRTSETNKDGVFGFAALPAGRYDVSIVHNGAPSGGHEAIDLLPNGRWRIDLPLRRTPWPEPITVTPHGHWAPRVGFALSPGRRRQVFRGAYGLFHGSTSAVVPALPGRYIDSFVSGDFTTPRAHQATVGWAVQTYAAASLGIGYLFARGEHLPRVINRYAVRRTLRRNSLESTAESLYNGVTLHGRGRVLPQLFYRGSSGKRST